MEKSLYSERPPEPKGYGWDIEMALAYKTMQESKAWQHFRDNVLTLRESMVQQWLAGKAGSENYRLTIKLCDDLLRVPQKMIEEGKRAQQVSERMQEQRRVAETL